MSVEKIPINRILERIRTRLEYQYSENFRVLHNRIYKPHKAGTQIIICHQRNYTHFYIRKTQSNLEFSLILMHFLFSVFYHNSDMTIHYVCHLQPRC